MQWIIDSLFILANDGTKLVPNPVGWGVIYMVMYSVAMFWGAYSNPTLSLGEAVFSSLILALVGTVILMFIAFVFASISPEAASLIITFLAALVLAGLVSYRVGRYVKRKSRR